MILRRIIQHVRKQEWTAIVIDLLIVVVGVYFGIQAQTWNAAREDREIERQYLQSLHDQISNMIEDNESRVETNRDELIDLREVGAALEAIGEITELEKRHCNAIVSSHIYVGRISVPPTIEELITTGRLQLIRNSAVRLAIISYSQTIEGYRQLNADIQSDRMVLSRQYSSMITLNLRDDDVAKCDFEAMRRSLAFRNDLADNSYRHAAYVRDVVIGQQDQRMNLHFVLDRELGISHSDDLLD